MTSPRIRRRTGAAVATGLAAALALSGLAAVPASAAAPAAPAAPAASATAGTVSDAVFAWGVSNEANNSAYSGFNLLSASKVVKNDASDPLIESEWKATNGNVTIQKKDAAGTYTTSTWAGLRTTASGGSLGSPTAAAYSDNRISIANGTGTVDAENDDADIQWDGDVTVAFYSGLTQFFLSDPHLVVENGAGTVTATLGGYGTDMNDTSLFVPLDDQVVTVATLSGVDVDDTGIASADTDYLGVEVTVPEGTTTQKRDGAVWGSFPQQMVDFQGLTGQSSYWYSSGGSTDSAKVSLPIDVAYTVTPTAAAPSITVSKATGLNPSGETLTVTGTGFTPHAPETTGTRPPLAGTFTGAYVTFGTFLDTWKPSEGAPSSARKALSSTTKWVLDAADVDTVGGPSRGAVALDADGGFSVTIDVTKGFSGALADGNFGVYTYAAGGATYAPFETFTPVAFADPAVDRIQGADRYEVAVNVSKTAYPTESGSDVAYVVTGTTFADALSAAPAAVEEKAPLLLTTPDALPSSVKTELQRLSPGKIVIVGGPNSVSTRVEAELQKLAATVQRISGADRYEASRNVVDTVFGIAGAKNAYVATGATFPDALSASAAGGSTATPVLLVNGGASTVDSATTALLTKLGVDTVSIAGGPNSVSEGIKASLEALNGKTDPTEKVVVTRLSGADRFAASISINNSAFTWANTVYLATGLNYPDALAGAALAGLNGSPLYVVPGDCVPQGVLADIDRLGAGQVTLLGGPNSLSAKVASLTACTF